MQVTETLSEGLKHEFSFLVPAADIQANVMAKLKEVGAQVRLPGFRPGKVPMPVLKQRFGKSALGEVLETTVNENTQKAIDDRGLKPAVTPKVEIVKFEEGSDLEFKAAVEVLPEITAMNFAEITIERLEAEAEASEIDAALDRMAQGMRDSAPVDEGEAAADGDKVTIDFVGRIDGVEFEGGAATDYPLDLAEGTFVPGFVGQLVGAKAGETREVTVIFPADYGAENLAGKTAVFETTVKGVARYVPTPIDDELAKKIGMDSLDALRTAVRERIEREYKQLGRTRLKRLLFDALEKGHDFPLPETLVEQEFQSIWTEVKQQLEGPNAEQAREGKTDEELQAEYKIVAARRVRLGLLLAEVGRTNNISVSQEDLGRAMQAEASRYPGQEQQVFEFFRSNPQAMTRLQAPILEEKVVDYILELATVEPRKVTPDELRKAVEEEETKTAA